VSEPADVGEEASSATPAVDDEPAATEPADATQQVEPRRDGEPELTDDIQFADLDPDARRELKSLSKSVAELVGRHLVAAGVLIDEDPELALAHARFARTRASRVAVVREAAGITAYHAGEWAEALGEFRAVRRMTGSQAHLPVMVDCERALGRPERALELAAEASDLSTDIAVELRIVAAGARRDLGQLDAAVVALQGPDLDPKLRQPWSARLFYAYADNLEAAGRTEDAIRWFLNAAEADLDEETDAAERATALS
jgi:tetratricopeptide (TPR) repeat protein